MKAQFKYAFITGLYIRGIVFSVIFVMNAVFLTLGSLGALPFPAHITAVSLGGVAVAVMLCVNVVSDVFIARRMFSSPESYLYALTPAPRWKILLASVLVMTALDIITMIFVIAAETFLSFNLAGGGVWNIVKNYLSQNTDLLAYGVFGLLFVIAGYMLVIMIILFCITAGKSIFFKLPASGFLAFLLGCGCLYAISLLQFILAPFGSLQIFAVFFIINVNAIIALPVLFILTVMEAAALFIITSKLLERRINL
ncbi:MAG: hypothetical protein FWC19_09270 [Treponema sp.]|nr:hypothetical protein [Treponema sp.]MCL2272973.1 hypothetical protein [Treponema sp.]